MTVLQYTFLQDVSLEELKDLLLQKTHHQYKGFIITNNMSGGHTRSRDYCLYGRGKYNWWIESNWSSITENGTVLNLRDS